MASDPSKPLLRLTPQPEQDRLVGKPRSIPKPSGFPQDRQIGAFSPKFDRLADVLNRDPTGLELRADPAGLAPERLLVCQRALNRDPGLEWAPRAGQASGCGLDRGPGVAILELLRAEITQSGM